MSRNVSTSPSQATLALPSDKEKRALEKDVENGHPSRRGLNTGSETKQAKDNADVSVHAIGHGKSYKDMSEAERQDYLSDTVAAGEKKFHKLGWIQLVVVLIVEAIALGALSLPK